MSDRGWTPAAHLSANADVPDCAYVINPHVKIPASQTRRSHGVSYAKHLDHDLASREFSPELVLDGVCERYKRKHPKKVARLMADELTKTLVDHYWRCALESLT